MSALVDTCDADTRSLMTLPVGDWRASHFLMARESLGMTQAELASSIEYDHSIIARIESGDVLLRPVVELAIRYLLERLPLGRRLTAKAPAEVSRFRQAGEAVGTVLPDQVGTAGPEVRLADGPVVWLRLLPEFDQGRRLSADEIRRVMGLGTYPLVQLTDVGADSGLVQGQDGIGAFAGPAAAATSVSYVFDTGEIWSVDAGLVDAVRRMAASRRHMVGMPYLEDRFKYALHAFRQMLGRFGFRTPYRWIAGVEGIAQAGLCFPSPRDQYFELPSLHGMARIDRVSREGCMHEADTAASALKPFFLKVFEAFGVERPDYLDDIANPL